ncbi:MAG: hypothetical protein ACE5KJ_03340 [Candidatus Zixiibacteriota bacterium]
MIQIRIFSCVSDFLLVLMLSGGCCHPPISRPRIRASPLDDNIQREQERLSNKGLIPVEK